MKVLNCETSRVACHSTGMISGRVVIVRGHLDLKNVHTGDIIVAKQTDVNYTPQMLIASAIITEEGEDFHMLRPLPERIISRVLLDV